MRNLSFSLPNPPEGYSYLHKKFNDAYDAIFLKSSRYPKPTIWGFVNLKTGKLHSPINSKSPGKIATYVTAYSAMLPPKNCANSISVTSLSSDTSEVPYNTSRKEKTVTSTTFADYAASAEDRKNIAASVLKHTYVLCEALRQNYIDYSIRSHKRSVELGQSVDYHKACIADLKSGQCGYEFYPETGRKYHKVIMNANGSRSVHCFIDKKTGEIYKAASFKAPAKGVRFDLRLISDREWLLENADWSGSYLYKR